jgi:uncharacterized membrane-anchored protein
MEEITGILVGAIAIFLLLVLARLLRKIWKAETTHARHLRDERKTREEEYPD